MLLPSRQRPQIGILLVLLCCHEITAGLSKVNCGSPLRRYCRMMQVHIFATDDGTRDGTGPLQFVPDDPRAVLLGNPRALPWRYFATVGLEDSFLSFEPSTTRQALLSTRSVISKRLAAPIHRALNSRPGS
jgi:hypothetical protein